MRLIIMNLKSRVFGKAGWVLDCVSYKTVVKTFVGPNSLPLRLLICFTVFQMKHIGLFGSICIKLRKICRKQLSSPFRQLQISAVHMGDKT